MKKQELTPEEKELIREAKNAYWREWYSRNKDKCKEKKDQYWLRKAKQQQAAKEANENE